MRGPHSRSLLSARFVLACSAARAMFRSICLPLFLLLLVPPGAGLSADSPNPQTSQHPAERVEALIDRLREVANPDFGYSTCVAGTIFLPLEREGQHAGPKVLLAGSWTEPPLRRSAALRELVRIGLPAVPHLLDHLDDQRPTQIPPYLLLGGWPNRMLVNYCDYNERTQEAPATHKEKGAPQVAEQPYYRPTVGDLCAVALGQIVNRDFDAVSYSAVLRVVFISSPTRSPSLRAAIKESWGGLTMTEAEWVSSTSPEAMLEFLRRSGWLSERKLRLFACACARRGWPLLADERSRDAVQVAERYADGRASEAERKATSAAVPCRYGNPDDVTDPENIGAFGTEAAACTAFGADDYPPVPTYAVTCAIAAARAAANAAACAASSPLRTERTTAEGVADRVYRAEQKVGAALVRDIFGNPFRPPPALPPSLLTTDIIALARSIYQERKLPEGTLDPGRLAALAAALEAAGCPDASLLAHLRGPGPHHRGCAALDVVLGRR